MEIREATINDADAIVRIRRLASQNELEFPLTVAMLAKAIKRHCKAFVLVNDLEEVVGFSLADKAAKSIWGLFVWEPYQGKGYGKLLLQVACDWLFEQRSGWWCRKIEQITLTTAKKSDAYQIYLKHGWQDIGTDKRGDAILQLLKSTIYS